MLFVSQIVFAASLCSIKMFYRVKQDLTSPKHYFGQVLKV